jgi:hypothetical protein
VPNGFRVVRTLQTTLDALGAGLVDFFPPGVDWATQNTSVSVTYETIHPAPTNPPEPVAETYINGVFWEGSYTGSKDSSNTRVVLNPGDDYQIRWTGGQPNATAHATVTAVQYPPGMAPAE